METTADEIGHGIYIIIIIVIIILFIIIIDVIVVAFAALPEARQGTGVRQLAHRHLQLRRRCFSPRAAHHYGRLHHQIHCA